MWSNGHDRRANDLRSRTRRGKRRSRGTPFLRPTMSARALVLAFLLLVSFSVPFDARARQRSHATPDRDALMEIAARGRVQGGLARARVDAATRNWRIPALVADSLAATIQLMDVRDGRPVYYRVHNRQAIATIRADRLHVDGPFGWNLEGDGERLGLWDASRVLTSHVEFQGRVAQRDAPPILLNHATHVAGTMVASGVFTDARGAAPAAGLDAWDWNDDVTEMALWAAEGGLVSNHSYGQTAGWTFNLRGDGRWAWQGDASVDAEKDWRFGYYDEQAAAWDALAAAAPGYLIVKSAGNEPSDHGPVRGEPYWAFTDQWVLTDRPRSGDGGADGYDTLLDASVAKNVLTVGAVSDIGWDGRTASDIQLMDISGRGPTDDGRIKPDVVASGELVLSSMAWGDNGYGSSSGTSHASPAVAGAAILLQQESRRRTGMPLTAAALKGLIIHTADGMGPAAGPDYAAGWGLVNAEQAVRHMQAFGVIDSLLTGGATHEYSVELDAGDSLQVTLSWTDPAGTVGPRSPNERRSALVNDLDMVVEGPGDIVYRPWKLDPDHPSAPAVRGDNTVDPVEQIAARVTASGTYRIRVRHKGVLQDADRGDGQAYALWSGVASTTETPATASGLLSGRVVTGGVGVANVTVYLSGPRYTQRNSGPDGSFLFADLPEGTYTLRVEGDGHVVPDEQVVSLPATGPIVISLPGAFSVSGLSALTTPDLLQVAESASATWNVSVAAGSVFGLVLTMDRHDGSTAGSARVDLDTTFDPAVTPYIGSSADSWLRASADWLLSPAPDGSWTKRIPLLWTGGATPPGTVIRIPFRIRNVSGSTVLAADTLRIPVSGPDVDAPLVRAHVIRGGEGYAPPGSNVVVQAQVWDGTPVPEVIARLAPVGDLSRTATEARLLDSGDLSVQQDIVYRDGVFTGVARLPDEGDFRVQFLAVDALGNASATWSDFVFSSRPFAHSERLAVWTSSWFASGTGRAWTALADASIPYDAWDEVVRGTPPPGVFDDHDVLLWIPSIERLESEDARSQVDAFLASGRPVVLVLPGKAPSANTSEWLLAHFGAAPSPLSWRAEQQLATLADTFDGWQAVPALPVALGLAPSQPDATVLVETASGEALAVRKNRAVATTIPVATLREDAYRSGFLSRLLVGATGDSTFAPPPLPPAQVRIEAPAGDNLLVSWTPRPFSVYEVELADGAGRLIDSVRTSATKWTVVSANPVPDPESLTVRIRSVSPVGVGEWALFGATATHTEDAVLPAGLDLTIRSLYPHPARSTVTADVIVPAPGLVTTTVYSPLGRRVGPPRVTLAGRGSLMLSLDTSGLASGMYLLEVATETRRVVRPLVVMRP